MLRPKQLVFATGMSGKPNIPTFTGMDVFKGEQHHSSKHPGPDAYKGKKVVVIGSNNSAHDICAALWEDGADVTMVQRSLDPYRAVRHADGDRPRRPLLRRGRARRHDHGQGRPDLRLAALPDPARVPDPALRGDGASATPTSTRALEKAGLPARLGRRRLGPVHEVPAARLGLLHRRRRLAS